MNWKVNEMLAPLLGYSGWSTELRDSTSLKVQVVAESIREARNQRIILQAIVVVVNAVVEDKEVIWPCETLTH